MRLELKELGLSPFARDAATLAAWVPDDPENFAVPFCASIGTEGESGGDDFDGVVCSPRWLVEHDWSEIDNDPARPGTMCGHALIIQRRWSYEDLRATIESLCAEGEAPTYRPLANKLGRYLEWEYDYRFDEGLGVRDRTELDR